MLPVAAIPSLLSVGSSIIGGLFSSSSAKKAAAAQAEQARLQAERLKEAGKWKAIGTTNRYGSSEQTVDPSSGALTEASWNMSPEMKAYQDKMFAGSAEALPANFDPEAATQAQYQLLKNQQAPGVERGYSGLLSNLMNKGTMGLRTGGTEGIGGSSALQQSNPEMEAYMNAVAQQDALNLTGAQTQVRSMMDSDINRANGLMSNFNNVEDRGNAALDRTVAWGTDQRDAALRTVGAAGAQTSAAAQITADANSGSAIGSLLQGVGSNQQLASSISGMFSPKANSVVPTGIDTRSGQDIINSFKW